MEEDNDQLAAVRSLHHELTTVEETRLLSLEKLCLDLENHIEAFRKLLDKTARNDASRQTLASGKIKIDDDEYEVNSDFKEEATRLSDLLDLDQLESASLLLHGTEEAKTLDRAPIACAIIRFHSYRSFLVESLRLVLKLSLDLDADEVIRNTMQQVVAMIFGSQTGTATNPSAYAQKCMLTMSSIEIWLNLLADQVQKEVTLGQTLPPALEEIMGLQQQNLTRQHESLGIILTYLVNGHYTKVDDFKKLLNQMPNVDKWNVLAVHYAPVLIAFCSHFGSTEGNVGFDDCRELHNVIMKSRESRPWPLRNFGAAFMTWWLAEYASWFFDAPSGGPQDSIQDPEKEAQDRSDALYEALREGGFHCTLSICSQIKSSEWYDPARVGLIRSLLYDAPILPFEPASISPAFRESVLEAFDFFTGAFITNLPDSLRRFKADEDDNRRRMLSGLLENGYPENDRHLERFFVIMSYVYEGRPDAADIFWTDAEGNMYGFLEWFSRRVSTPLMGAFCEMFRSISAGENYATAAHKFLLDEGSTSSSRMRRSSSLSWAQIFEELEFYASKVRETPNPSSTTSIGKRKSVDVDEPETPVMLECYLRLIAHLALQSAAVRKWILSHPTYKLVDTLFALSNSTIPSPIRACSYSCLQSLLTEKSAAVSTMIWTSLDQWVSNGFSAGSNIPRPARLANSSSWAEDLTFETISANHEEANSFVTLIQALLEPSAEAMVLNDSLPFPEELGSSYRHPGVEPYIDLVLGKVFATKVGQADPSLKQMTLASDILRFIQTCLEAFNENLIILANRSGMAMDSLIGSSTLAVYAQMHPFTRVMEWMFNDRVLVALFKMAHQGVSEVTNAQPDSPLVVCLKRSVEVINLIMRLQSTYLDVVRPLVKAQAGVRRNPVLNPALVCFEDAVATNLRIVVDLGYYAGSGHKDLALASLELLKQFAASRKLNVVQSNRNGSRVTVNRLVGALQQQADVEPIAVSMSQALGFDDHEIAQEHLAPGFDIKYGILEFLDMTLSAHPDHPNVAHALLGFDCVGGTVRVKEDSLFANGSSLFHVITKLSIEYPEMVDESMRYWCISVKSKAASILRTLWSSPLTSSIVLEEMKEARVLSWQWLTQSPIDQQTLWDGQRSNDPLFVFLDGASALEQYLRTRGGVYEFTSASLRKSDEAHIPTAQVQILSTLLGMTVVDDTEQENPDVFQLADFIELEVFPPSDIDFQISRDIDFGLASKPTPTGQPRFDLALVEQLLTLRRKALRQANLLTDEGSEDRMDQEIRDALAFFNAFNNYHAILAARFGAIRAWADLTIVLVQSKELEVELRSSLVLQALQLVLPKLELSAAANSPEALVFARLVQSLLSNVSSTDPALADGHAGDAANDRLFNLFKIALKAIASPDASAPFRAILYNVAYRYLSTLLAESSDAALPYIGHANTVVKLAGHALVDILCDDILDAAGSQRVAALLLLASLTRLAERSASSRHVLEALVRSNFIVVLVETIADMPDELRNAAPSDIPALVQGYRATLTLLLTVAQAKQQGATHVLNAGLFAAVRQSGLFAADPDIGLAADGNTSALRAYYELLAGVLRVIVAVVVGRGAANNPTVSQARRFLLENRLAMVGALKRRARAAAGEEANGESRVDRNGGEVDERLEEVVELFVVLTNLTGFVEYEEAQDNTPKTRMGQFS